MTLQKVKKLQHQRGIVAGWISSASIRPKPSIKRRWWIWMDCRSAPCFHSPQRPRAFHEQFWRQLRKRLPSEISELQGARLADHLVFAVEASCNLWPTLVHYLEGEGQRVLKPLTST